MDNHKFCFQHSHQSPSSLGRYNEPLPPSIATKLADKTAKAIKAKKKKWYSRLKMWEVASDMDYDSVMQMTDADYDKALVLVNDNFRKHPVLIKENSLEPHKGPQSAEERRSIKADYLGKPKKFRFYSNVVFRSELRNIRPGLTLLDASEREVMEGLQRTNHTLLNWSMMRNLDVAFHYQGPQCWIQFGDHNGVELFEPEKYAASTQRPQPSKSSTDWLQCGP